MSMIGNFQQVTPAQLDALIAAPDSVEEFLYPDEEPREDGIDIDKSWHGLHFLLTGDAWEGAKPLCDAILGGTEIGADVGYGPARYVDARTVAAIAAELQQWPAERLAQRYDPTALARNEIYPQIWDEGEEALEYLLVWYQKMREYYLDAAAKGNAMLVFLN